MATSQYVAISRHFSVSVGIHTHNANTRSTGDFEKWNESSFCVLVILVLFALAGSQCHSLYCCLLIIIQPLGLFTHHQIAEQQQEKICHTLKTRCYRFYELDVLTALYTMQSI